MTSKNKVLSLTTIAAISAILLVSVPGTAFGSAEPLVLTLNPDSFTADAFPGQVINIDIDLVFPFEAGDQIFGFTNTNECDDGIGLSGNAPNPTQPETVITLDLEITIAPGVVRGDELHCLTTFQVSDSSNFSLDTAPFEIWITVVDHLDITPDSVSFDAFPGEVIMLDMTFDFPFANGDNIIGIVETEDCDEEIDLSGVTDPIDGTTTIVSGVLTITLASDAEVGTYHCENQFTVRDSGFNVLSDIAILEIWITVTPEGVIEGLINEVDDLGLNNGNTKSLEKKLEQAINNITNEDPTDDAEACEKLQSFIDQLNAFVNAGKITQGDADPLIDAAEALIDELCQD